MLIRSLVAAALLTAPVLAQTAAPAAPPPGSTGVKPEDQSMCSNAATQATGYVPGQAPPPTMTNPNAGARAGGAAVGAAAGATTGAIQNNQHPYAPPAVKNDNVGNKAASGAAAGAIVGGSQVRRGRRQAAAANNQAQQQAAAKQTAWNNSYTACMTNKGYVAQ